jgi:hypothetical protein
MSAMNIDRVLEVLERELAIFEENEGQERAEETSADRPTLEKYTELWSQFWANDAVPRRWQRSDCPASTSTAA